MARSNILIAQASANWDAANQWQDTGDSEFYAPGNGDECRLNGKTVAINIVRVPATSGILTSINAKNAAGAQTAGNLTCNLTTVGAAVSIFSTNMAAGSVPLLVSAGATNLLTIDCTGGTVSASSATYSTAITIAGSHPSHFIGSTSGGSAEGAKGISYTGTGTHTSTILNVSGGSGYYAHGIVGNAGTNTITLTGLATGGSTGIGSYAILGYPGNLTVNGGNCVDTAMNTAMVGVKWNPSATTYHQVAGTGSPKLRPETSVAAAIALLSGTPRWTGATGADIGTLPYTRKRGALR